MVSFILKEILIIVFKPKRLNLKAFECFEFGRVAYNKKDNHNTIRWMKEALNQLEFEKGNATVSEVEILDYLSYACFEV